MFCKFGVVFTIVAFIFATIVVAEDVPLSELIQEPTIISDDKYDNVPADSFENEELPPSTESLSPIDNLEYIEQFNTGCSVAINSNGLPEPQPLLIIPGTNRFKNPERRTGIIRFDRDETVELFCSGSFVSFPNTRNLMARCLNGVLFHVSGREMTFNQLRCTDQVWHTGRFASVQNCGHNATALEIGFQLNPTRFLKTLDICHDERLESTLYVKYDQTPANQGFQRSFPRPSFITGPFFGGRNVDRLYFGAVQRITIGGIVGNARVDQLWDNDRDFFLARGHLAARADSIYGSQQRATFYFVNAAPQWHSFNAGNWERIENGVRVMVADRNIDTEIYTGTWGIATLPDSNGIQRQLFLDFDARGNGLIPVPRFFYKVVISTRFRRGVVFVGVNNPHATWAEINSGRYNICRDVSSQINYINWNRSSLSMGYSYACDVNDFIRTVNHLPASVRSDSLLV